MFIEPMEALDALEKAERVEMLITRVKFAPGKINGVALALMARAKRPGIQVIFTALAEFEHLAAGLGEFMAAPVNVPDVVAVVERLLNRASYCSILSSDATVNGIPSPFIVSASIDPISSSRSMMSTSIVV